MNLPTFSPINSNRSTYYTFSKALHDLDKSVTEGTPYYFTKMVTLNLPIWDLNELLGMHFKMRLQNSVPPGDIIGENHGDLELDSDDFFNPSKVIPKVLKFYVENLIRQENILNNSNDSIEQIAELAFWKFLNLLHISTDNIYGSTSTDYQSLVTYISDISTTNFIDVSNNHGWAEIIGPVPNICESLNIKDNGNCWKTLTDVDNLINCDTSNNDSQMYDNNSKQFNMTSQKKILNFTDIFNSAFNSSDVHEFEFNTLLLFYTDGSNYNDGTPIHKLHGVDFIFPFELGSSNYYMETINHIANNSVQTFGYSFQFLMKSNNNNETQDIIYEKNIETYLEGLDSCMGAFKSFLEEKTYDGDIV